MGPSDVTQLKARLEELSRDLPFPGATRQRHHSEARGSKIYVTVPPDRLGDDDFLIAWLARAGQAQQARNPVG